MARILVVDDDERARIMLREALEVDGHEVSFAKDGNAGLELARQAGFDLVLVNLGLPNGLRMTRELKEDSPGVLVMVISGDADQLARAEEFGAQRFLTKPFQPEDIHQAIQTVLDKPGAWDDVMP